MVPTRDTEHLIVTAHYRPVSLPRSENLTPVAHATHESGTLKSDIMYVGYDVSDNSALAAVR